MKFEIVGQIAYIEVIASGSGVRVRRYLRKTYGPGRWRKLKKVEVHWYEAHGIGRKDLKIKRYLEES